MVISGIMIGLGVAEDLGLNVETGLPPWWLVVAAVLFAPVLAATPDEWVCKVTGHRWGENSRYAAEGKCLRCEKAR